MNPLLQIEQYNKRRKFYQKRAKQVSELREREGKDRYSNQHYFRMKNLLLKPILNDAKR